MSILHISECPLVREESVALVSYVLSDWGIKYDSLGFKECDLAIDGLDPLRVKYLMVLNTDQDESLQMEVSILQARVDIEKENCSALLVRMFKNGVLEKDGLGLYHFYMRPWDADTVIPKLTAMPSLFKRTLN